MPRQQHPASIYHNFRRFVFSTYEKNGIDAALRLVKKSKHIPTTKAGLEGELIFYDTHKDGFRLEPLLDAGVKADFTGTKNGVFTNFDVTTNIDYKSVDDYLEVVQGRGKVYEIVLVDLKSEDIIFYPLKFPICKNCGNFSHYILYIEPPITEMAGLWSTSDEQSLIQYCSKCKDPREVLTLDFMIPTMGAFLDEISSELDVDETPRYTSDEIRQMKNDSSINIINFVERNCDLLLSGLAENYYVVINPQHYDGYYDGLLYWRHPLARDLSDFLGLYYGQWEPKYSDLKKMFGDTKCKLCGHSPMRLNSKKKTLTCYKCGLIHDYSKVLTVKGWELRRTRRKKSPFKDFQPSLRW